jgi:hypothetical protein
MQYKIEYNNVEKRFYLFEYVGDEPVEYECTQSSCWRDCVPCCVCEDSEKIIPNQAEYTNWKAKFDKRVIIPCSKKNYEYFSYHNLNTIEFTDRYFEIVDGEAVPYIQKEINFIF